MPGNASVTLDDRYDEFVRRQVAAGNFSSPGEAVRAGLRLLEERELKLEQLRRAIDEGDEGPFEAFDVDEFLTSRTRSE
jgi:antitoxin ParD1/3/4